jgi:hypothetical protein
MYLARLLARVGVELVGDRMDWPKPGTTVTPIRRTEAYYSGYAGRPECFLEPGESATVASVDVPPVRGRRGNFLTACFARGGERWTVALWPGEYSVVGASGNARGVARRIAGGAA